MPKKAEKAKERLVLLDAHAIIHRAYHALPDFATSKGEPTGALYGLVSMIFKIASDLEPDYIVAAYDLPKPTYRHEVYEGYKAGRAKTDDDLALQIERSRDVCAALSIPIYSKEGFEADDILGTIVEKLKNKQTEIIVASGDMDTMQLVDNEKVKVYTLKKGLNDTILYDEKGVKERFGFKPELLPDYKGLRGDPSDNIIGIPGIGEKTATDLIVNFGTIEEIYKILKKNPQKLQDKGVKERIIELLKNGEEEARFSKMLATIRRDAPIDFELPRAKWRESINTEEARKIFAEFEFRNMSKRLDEVLGIKESSKISDTDKKIDPEQLEETKVALWVIDSNKTDPTLEDIYNFTNKTDFEKSREMILAELQRRQVAEVFENIEKPLIPLMQRMQSHGILINQEYLKKLDKEYSKELLSLEKKIWQLAGVEFNISSPKQLGDILFDKLQLSVKNQKKTSTGAKSTRESELEKMKDLHPIVPLILEYREFSKLISTYIKPIPKLVDKDSRLHARFIQTGSTTGRMSSENPNMQNIPIGTERGRAIREAFIAPKGSTLLGLDYSQIELRIAAFLSDDQTLIDIFKTGSDIHTAVAAKVFMVSEDKVDKEMRRKAKVINFGILYGMGVNALQANLKTDRKTAMDFYNAYFYQFGGLAEYIDKMKVEVERLGFTKTFFGRRRYFEGIKSKIPYIKAAAERMAVNAPIQGTQADLIKIAMSRVETWIEQNNLRDKVHLLLQIHDELIYEVEDGALELARKEVKKIMESVLTMEETKGVPIIVNSSMGSTWAQMK